MFGIKAAAFYLSIKKKVDKLFECGSVAVFVLSWTRGTQTKVLIIKFSRQIPVKTEMGFPIFSCRKQLKKTPI